MANEKPWKIVDYIDRFEVLDILDRMADWYAEPPVDIKELKLVHEIGFKIKQLQSIDAKEVVWCKDCEYRYTKNCKAKHERADLDFCSSGKRKSGKDINVPTKDGGAK